MRLSIHRNAIAAIVLAAASSIAHATPTVILYSPLSASAVDSILVNGIDYNVTFGLGASFTFDQQPALAQIAANELAAALNGSPAIYVQTQFGPVGRFHVEDGSNGQASGVIVNDPAGQQGSWLSNTINQSQAIGAIFTPAAAITPEPSSLILLGTGALALCGAIRRRLTYHA